MNECDGNVLGVELLLQPLPTLGQEHVEVTTASTNIHYTQCCRNRINQETLQMLGLWRRQPYTLQQKTSLTCNHDQSGEDNPCTL